MYIKAIRITLCFFKKVKGFIVIFRQVFNQCLGKGDIYINWQLKFEAISNDSNIKHNL